MKKFKNHTMDYDYDCGPCPLAIWLSAYNINDLDPKKLIKTLGTTKKDGTSWSKIRTFINRYHLFEIITGKNLTLAKKYLDKKLPLFICWQVYGKAYWSHYSILVKLEWEKVVMLNPEDTQKFTSMEFTEFINFWGKEDFWYAVLTPQKKMIRRMRGITSLRADSSSTFQIIKQPETKEKGVLNVTKVDKWIKQA